jgi:hypothetical protein
VILVVLEKWDAISQDKYEQRESTMADESFPKSNTFRQKESFPDKSE